MSFVGLKNRRVRIWTRTMDSHSVHVDAWAQSAQVNPEIPNLYLAAERGTRFLLDSSQHIGVKLRAVQDRKQCHNRDEHQQYQPDSGPQHVFRTTAGSSSSGRNSRGPARRTIRKRWLR